MPTATAAPVVLGDHLAAAPEDEKLFLEWLHRALVLAPDAWLTLPASDSRESADGRRYAVFVAPTEAHFLACKDFPADSLPPIFTLREAAAALIRNNCGACILHRADAADPRLIFSVGDLVKLTIDGDFLPKAAHSEWEPYRYNEADEEGRTPISLFFADPADPDKTAPVDTASPPEIVIPPPLDECLRTVLKSKAPQLAYPVLARNKRGKLALIFTAKTIHDLRAAAEELPNISALFPGHYHMLYVPKAAF